MMSYRKILVTGACGQLGSELQRLVSNYGLAENFVFTDIVSKKSDILRLDICDCEELSKTVSERQIDVVINCAAYTNVDMAEEDEESAMKINCDAVRNLALACKENGALMMHVSTDYVFGGDACTPYDEETLTNPKNVYGKTKSAGEKALMDSGCDAIIIRTAWLYSPYGKNFVKTMLGLTGEKDSLKVVFDQVGSPTNAENLAIAILKIVTDENVRKKTGIYHYTDEGVCSWFDFATSIGELSGHRNCHIEPCRSADFPTKATRPSFSVLDKSKIKSVFGIEIPHWRTSLEKCIERIMTNDI